MVNLVNNSNEGGKVRLDLSQHPINTIYLTLNAHFKCIKYAIIAAITLRTCMFDYKGASLSN